MESDYEVWDFPPLCSDEPFVEATNKEVNPANEQAAELLQAQQQEILQLKRHLQEKIQLLNNIQSQLQNTVSQLDEDLLIKMMDCIKTVTGKILCKEITEDPTRLKDMITEALFQIKHNQNSAILLSSEDFEALQNEDVGNIKPFLQPVFDLTRGDFKIITPTGEIVAILQDRLNSYFGL